MPLHEKKDPNSWLGSEIDVYGFYSTETFPDQEEQKMSPVEMTLWIVFHFPFEPERCFCT